MATMQILVEIVDIFHMDVNVDIVGLLYSFYMFYGLYLNHTTVNCISNFKKKIKPASSFGWYLSLSLVRQQQNSFEWNCSSKFFSSNSSFICLFFAWIRWLETKHNGILHFYFYEMAKTINIRQNKTKWCWWKAKKNAHIPIMNTTRAQQRQPAPATWRKSATRKHVYCFIFFLFFFHAGAFIRLFLLY